MSAPATVTKLPPFTLLDEPCLAFSPSNATQVDVHPLRGLVSYGPYSKGSFGGYTPRVRIATVGPASAFKRRGELMLSLRNPHRPSDRSEYVPEYPGFEALFQVGLESAPAEAHVKWPEHLHELPGDGDAPARLFLAMEAAIRSAYASPIYRTGAAPGRAASSTSELDKIRPLEWADDWNDELLQLLSLITITIDEGPVLGALFDRICVGQLVTADDLPSPDPAERHPPATAHQPVFDF